VPTPAAVTLNAALSLYVAEKLLRGWAVIANAAPDDALELEELLELELLDELDELELLLLSTTQ